jgi:hypothetical protein
MHSHLLPNPDEIRFLISPIAMSFLHVFKLHHFPDALFHRECDYMEVQYYMSITNHSDIF